MLANNRITDLADAIAGWHTVHHNFNDRRFPLGLAYRLGLVQVASSSSP